MSDALARIPAAIIQFFGSILAELIPKKQIDTTVNTKKPSPDTEITDTNGNGNIIIGNNEGSINTGTINVNIVKDSQKQQIEYETQKFKPFIEKRESYPILTDDVAAIYVSSVHGSSFGQVIPYKNGFQAKVHASAFENNNPGNFVMACIQYVPYENWALFYKNNYALDFSINFSDTVKAVQLEVKDQENINKVIDDEIKNSYNHGNQHISINLASKRNQKSFEKIHEICFTVFVESSYIEIDQDGEFTITNLMLTPSA